MTSRGGSRSSPDGTGPPRAGGAGGQRGQCEAAHWSHCEARPVWIQLSDQHGCPTGQARVQEGTCDPSTWSAVTPPRS
jgi:hypothetical protein